jgi:prophage regulatory protein
MLGAVTVSSLQISKLRQVSNQTGLSEPTIYRLVKEKKFPPPIKLGMRASGWVQADIDEWLEARIREQREKQQAADASEPSNPSE